MVKVINIDTKTKTIRIDNADSDIKTWRTTESGTHFPIKKGQTTKEGLQEFLKKHVIVTGIPDKPETKKESDFDEATWTKAYEEASKRAKGYPTFAEVQSMYDYMQEQQQPAKKEQTTQKGKGPKDVLGSWFVKTDVTWEDLRDGLDAGKEIGEMIGNYDDDVVYRIAGELAKHTGEEHHNLYEKSEDNRRKHPIKQPGYFDRKERFARDKAQADKELAERLKQEKPAKKSIPSTQNESWGFYGTIANEFYDDKKRKYDDSKTKEAWDIAFEEVQNATGWNDDDVLEFLDSRDGRHFADQAADFGAGENMKDGISQAAKFWKERKWFPQKNTDAKFAEYAQKKNEEEAYKSLSDDEREAIDIIRKWKRGEIGDDEFVELCKKIKGSAISGIRKK